MTTQVWDPVRYARDAGFVADHGVAVVDLLAPQRGERILDLGCGDGVLTEQLVLSGADVIGVDTSPDLVAAARHRGLDARIADGRSLDFDGTFDAVFSNAALHWMADLDAVAGSVRRALRPGGRFVGEFGGHGNVAAVVEALTAALAARGIDAAPLNPWVFPTAETYTALLQDNGFTVAAIEVFARPTPLPGHLSDWLAVFAGPFLAAVAEDHRDRVVADVCAMLTPRLRDDDGIWRVDYVRLRFVAVASDGTIDVMDREQRRP